jgi:hypothetical protein
MRATCWGAGFAAVAFLGGMTILLNRRKYREILRKSMREGEVPFVARAEPGSRRADAQAGGAIDPPAAGHAQGPDRSLPPAF